MPQTMLSAAASALFFFWLLAHSQLVCGGSALASPAAWLPQLQPDPTVYRIGVQTTSVTTLSSPRTIFQQTQSLLKPLWVDTLSPLVPGVTIEVWPLEVSSSVGYGYRVWDAISATPRVFDMIFAGPFFMVCAAQEFGLRPVLSSYWPLLGVPSPVIPPVAFAPMASPVNHLTDLTGKKIAINNPVADIGTVALLASLVSKGIYIYDSAAFIIVGFSINVAFFRDFLGNEFDVFFSRADGVQLWNAAIAGNPSLASLKLVVGVNSRFVDAVYSSPVSPLNASVPFIPEWPVSILPGSSEALASLLVSALLTLNASSPGMSSATGNSGISNFVLPLDYSPITNLLIGTGLSTYSESGLGSCPHSTDIKHDLYAAIQCPPGKVVMSFQDVVNSCAVANKTSHCNGAYTGFCVCPPLCLAIPSEVLSVYLGAGSSLSAVARNNTPPANSTSCSTKFTSCLSVAQRTPVVLTVVDNYSQKLRSQLQLPSVANVSYLYAANVPADLTAAPFVALSAATMVAGVWQAQLPLPIPLGYWLLFVKVDGALLPSSPSIVVGTAPVCVGSLVATADGFCACPQATSLTGPLDPSTCAPLYSIPGAIGGSAGTAVAALLMAVALVLWRSRWAAHLADSSWVIRPSEIAMEDPPVALGVGTFGLVLKGTFRNTSVAVKLSRKLRQMPGSGSLLPKRGPLASETPVWQRSSTDLSIDAGTASLPLAASSSTLSPSVLSYVMADGAVSEALRAHRRAAADAAQDETLSMPSAASSVHEADSWLSRLMRFEVGGDVAAGGRNSGGTSYLHGRSSVGGMAAIRVAGVFGSCCGGNNDEEEFMAEIRTVITLRHPRIVTVLGAVVARGQPPAMVMELMDRGSVEDDLLYNPSFAFDAEVVHAIVKDVVQGLAFLHAAVPPILHGDIKPGNILVDAEMRAKVSDFGMTRVQTHRQSGGILTGTPFYLAPEVLRGESPSTASDVYAWGVTLYQLWTRRELYEGEQCLDVLAAVADRERQPPKRPWGDTDAMPASVPIAFADIIRRATHPEPAARPSFAQFATELAFVDNTAGRDSYMHRARANQVLADVFPPKVAQALREGRPVEPETHERVTIYFSDIVGFTSLSQQMTASEVADLLDRLYGKLDALLSKHELFKIDTIGDAYLSVSGLPEPRGDHTARIAAFALDAVDAASETPVKGADDLSLGFVAIRVGFHTGSCVAAVVGKRSPKYTLFGDTVNTASRMESHGRPGCVHLSREAAVALHEQSRVLAAGLVSRGLIDVKDRPPFRPRTYSIGPVTMDPIVRVDPVAPAPAEATLAAGLAGEDAGREAPEGASGRVHPAPFDVAIE